jgi:hypothetical protein
MPKQESTRKEQTKMTKESKTVTPVNVFSYALRRTLPY